MSPRPMTALIAKEFAETARSRWLAGFVGAFCVLAAVLAVVGSSGSTFGGQGFGRTTAALLNLVLLVVPLMGLTAGSLSLAGEKERGTMEFLLSLPLRPRQIFWAKFFGSSAALAAALGVAFGLVGLGLALRGGLRQAGVFAACFGATLLLAAVSLSLGLLISTRSRKVAGAVGFALLLWLILILGGDLGLLGTALAVRLPPQVLLGSAWLNPLSLYRLLAIDAASANLDMLGPAGSCAQDILGAWLRPAALAGLALWLAATLTAARWLYGRDPLENGR
jgi:Cu-processing system permease protein